MGFIENRIKEIRGQLLINQQQKDESASIEKEKERQRSIERQGRESDLKTAMGYLNDSIILKKLIEFKKKVDPKAKIIMGRYDGQEIEELPLEDQTIKSVLDKDYNFGYSHVDLELRWNISTYNGNYTYNYARFIYKANGEIEISCCKPAKLPLRKWRNNSNIQEKILEQAYMNPSSYDSQSGIVMGNS